MVLWNKEIKISKEDAELLIHRYNRSKVNEVALMDFMKEFEKL